MSSSAPVVTNRVNLQASQELLLENAEMGAIHSLFNDTNAWAQWLEDKGLRGVERIEITGSRHLFVIEDQRVGGGARLDPATGVLSARANPKRERMEFASVPLTSRVELDYESMVRTSADAVLGYVSAQMESTVRSHASLFEKALHHGCSGVLGIGDGVTNPGGATATFTIQDPFGHGSSRCYIEEGDFVKFFTPAGVMVTDLAPNAGPAGTASYFVVTGVEENVAGHFTTITVDGNIAAAVAATDLVCRWTPTAAGATYTAGTNTYPGPLVYPNGIHDIISDANPIQSSAGAAWPALPLFGGLSRITNTRLRATVVNANPGAAVLPANALPIRFEEFDSARNTVQDRSGSLMEYVYTSSKGETAYAGTVIGDRRYPTEPLDLPSGFRAVSHGDLVFLRGRYCPLGEFFFLSPEDWAIAQLAPHWLAPDGNPIRWVPDTNRYEATLYHIVQTICRRPIATGVFQNAAMEGFKP